MLHNDSLNKDVRIFVATAVIRVTYDHFLRTFCKKCIFTIENPKNDKTTAMATKIRTPLFKLSL